MSICQRCLAATLLISSLITTNVLGFNIDPKIANVISGPADTLFGYSVAMFGHGDDIRIVAGAPQDNNDGFGSNLTKSGNVYICDKHGICVSIDFTLARSVNGNQSNQWMGVAVDVDRDPTRIVMCGHRWQNIARGPIHLMLGICYEYGYSNNAEEFLTLYTPMYRQSLGKYVVNNMYYTGIAMTGMSAVYIPGEREILLGAPGLDDMRGGYVVMRNDTRIIKEKYIVTFVDHDTNTQSEAGHSVAVGSFTSGRLKYYVIGAPRAEKVFIYRNDKPGTALKIISQPVGPSLHEKCKATESAHQQLLTRFGDTVCTADIDNYGYDYLLIGAPMYTTIRDEGRVYVYKPIGVGVLLEDMRLIAELSGPGTIGARFGTGIGNVGDINSDGYTDIAIGAPYADEHQGVVYIYQGGRDGLRCQPVQKIWGRDINPELKGFGQSFSKPLDVDGNNIPDFLVGSPLSSQVVILRPSPIVEVIATLTPQHRTVNPDSHDCTDPIQHRAATCMSFYVTFTYHGQHAPDYIGIGFTLTADKYPDASVETNRVSFRVGDTLQSEITDNVTLGRGDHEFNITKSIMIRAWKDIFTDVIFEMNFHLLNNCIATKEKVPCPMLSKKTPNVVITELLFAKSCGTDNMCNSSLDVKAIWFSNYTTTPNRQYVPHKQNPLQLKVTLLNHNEDAYMAVVSTTHSREIQVRHVSTIDGPETVQCRMVRNDTALVPNDILKCLVGNPFRTGSPSTFIIEFEATDQVTTTGELLLEVMATTQSTEPEDQLADNKVLLQIPVRHHLKLQFKSSSDPETLMYAPVGDETDVQDKNRTIKLTQILHVYNDGKSPLQGGTITIDVPTSTPNGVPLFRPFSHKIRSNTAGGTEVTGDCSFPDHLMTSLPDHIDWDEEFMETSALIDNKNINITCSNKNCVTISCHLYDLPPDSAAQIEVHGYLYEATLQAFKTSGIIELISVAKITVTDRFLTNDSFTTGSALMVTELFAHITEKEGVPLWVYVVSALVGLILLIVFIVILWKCGFFRRKRHEDKEKLQNYLADDELSEPATPITLITRSSTASSSDAGSDHHAPTGEDKHFIFEHPDRLVQNPEYGHVGSFKAKE